MTKAQPDPIALFESWFESAQNTEAEYPDAASLATCDGRGLPHVRIVLVKFVDRRGFTFFTNLSSAKAKDLAENPRAALCFFWKSQKRQIRVEGAVEPIAPEEADRYFETRPRMSQIGAWASNQSQPLADEFELERSIAKFMARFHIGAVPRPAFWSGFRVIPERMEFWEERSFRLHKRRRFTKLSGRWSEELLFP